MDLSIIKELRRIYTGLTNERGRLIISTLTQIEANLENAETFRKQIPGDHSIHEVTLLVSTATMYESRANTLATLLGVLTSR